MQKDSFDRILNFLLGVSWAIVLFGTLITFKLFSSFGFSISLFLSIIYIFITLFLVLILDTFKINRERLQEAKKQTKLLEKIYTTSHN